MVLVVVSAGGLGGCLGGGGCGAGSEFSTQAGLTAAGAVRPAYLFISCLKGLSSAFILSVIDQIIHHRRVSQG
ncbi:MAG TPA: hypothetical protein DEQ51_02810 [Alphaproteobacteria bacterium]|nr:hypothetical protein [Alphaproteobacteria bacterium]